LLLLLLKRKLITLLYYILKSNLLLSFVTQKEGFPWDDLRKISRGCEWMAKVPNSEEKLPKEPFCLCHKHSPDGATPD